MEYNVYKNDFLPFFLVDKLTELLLGSSFDIPLACNGHHSYTGALMISEYDARALGCYTKRLSRLPYCVLLFVMKICKVGVV